MLELSLISAFLVGLLGGVHCVGMCGGIVSAVSVHLPQHKSNLSFLLAYNAGRILSYGLAGALAGLVGASSFFLAHILPVQEVLYAMSSLILIALGLYLAGLWHGVTYLENVGRMLWKVLQPIQNASFLSSIFLRLLCWGLYGDGYRVGWCIASSLAPLLLGVPYAAGY